MQPRRIYTLNNLPPEVRSVTFAKCSRSPEPFDKIAKELTEEKSADFHEKWVVGYGHSSVAEHAVLSIAMENVSILATKVIEDNRLASYTEKSTRYQIFNKDRYYKPANILSSPFGQEYINLGDFLFGVYEKFTPIVTEYIQKKYPRQDDEPEAKYNYRIKGKYCDIVRYLLPTATQTNLGMTINARSLEHAIRKLLSHPLQEMQDIGKEIKQVALTATPTLIKYADKNPYLFETDSVLNELTTKTLKFNSKEKGEDVTLVDYDHDAENKIITAILYKYSHYPYQQVKKLVDILPREEKEKIIDEALKKMTLHDAPIRELEHAYYTFDILIDYGAFRDIQRHRICTQTNQALSVDYGYNQPEELAEIGLENEFKEAMERAKEFYLKIYPEFPCEAQYLLPLAYKKRVLITWNLRELYHFIKLRTSPLGHISYRRIAQKCWQLINQVHPLLTKYIKVTLDKPPIS